MEAKFSYRRAENIYKRGQPATHLYQVITGAVRIETILNERERAVRSFCLPGEIFGLEQGKRYRWAAEAVVKTTVRRVDQVRLVQQARSDFVLAKTLSNITARELLRAEDHSIILRLPAIERVAAFLLDMANRSSLIKAGELKLPMNRADIGSYLGLVLETVARAITNLEDIKLIERLGEVQERNIKLGKSEKLFALLPPLQSLAEPPIRAAAIERLFSI